MYKVLAESQNFIVVNEYEEVYLIFITNNQKVHIGDFYGDPQAAAISSDESFCAMVGCGLIIYYLHEPFEEYQYDTLTSQWKEFYRSDGLELCIEDIEIIDDSELLLTVENVDAQNSCKFKLNVDSHELIKCK